VIQVADAGAHSDPTAASQIDRQLDFGFARISLFADLSHCQL
jgi:hypothetical protein